MLLGKGDGTLNGATFLQLAPQSSLPPGGNVGACQLTGVADFNNDGASDLIVGGAQILFVSNGDGTFSPASVIGGGPSFITGAISDINGDGNLDLVANDGVSVFLGNGDGTYSNRAVNLQLAWIHPFIWASPTDQDQLVNGPAVFAVEDFSGTGLPGIAMIVQTAPGGEISLPNPLPAPAPDFLISGGIPTVIAPGGQISFTVKSTPNRGIPRGCRLVLRWDYRRV